MAIYIGVKSVLFTNMIVFNRERKNIFFYYERITSFSLLHLPESSKWIFINEVWLIRFTKGKNIWKKEKKLQIIDILTIC